jgi:hypothetical protein
MDSNAQSASSDDTIIEEVVATTFIVYANKP